jgi:hypothetical protein
MCRNQALPAAFASRSVRLSFKRNSETGCAHALIVWLNCRLYRLPPPLPAPPYHAAGDDLLAAILFLLPPAALAAAEAVCRRWSALISEHGCWRHHALAVLAALGSKAAAVSGACSLEHASWKQRYLEAQVGAWTGSLDALHLFTCSPALHACCAPHTMT